MFPRVKQVRHLGEYRLELSFTDDTKGELDFKERVVGRGGVFTPLEDMDFFKRVQVDPEAGTIVWPNEVDFCPDVLYSLVTKAHTSRAQSKGARTANTCPPTTPRPRRRAWSSVLKVIAVQGHWRVAADFDLWRSSN